MQKGGNLPRIKMQNSTAVKEIIYKHGPISRSDIALRLGLTPPTITTNVSRLLHAGLVRECAPATETDPHLLGRRKVALEIAPDATYLIGAECGMRKTVLCLVNLRGEKRAELTLPRAEGDYEALLQMLASAVAALIAKSGIPRGKITGMGLGLPGRVDGHAGVLRRSEVFPWTDKPVASELARRTGIPCRLENSACCRALGQELFGLPCPDTFAYFYTSGAIACPFVVRGRLVAGGMSAAGEIGRMMQNGVRLAETASEAAVLKASRARLAQGRPGAQPEDVCFEDVLAAQEQGGQAVCGAVNAALDALGAALANIVCLLDPPLIMADGRILQPEGNRRRFLAAMQAGLPEQAPPVRFIPFMECSGARGAAALAIKKYILQQEMLERRAESDE